MEQRDLLRALGAAGALALLPNETMAAWVRVASGARPAEGLTEAQLALVGAIADTILPRTDTPSATDVGVPAFVDVVVSENYTDADGHCVVGLMPRCARRPPEATRRQLAPSALPVIEASSRRPARRAGAHILAAQGPRHARLFHERTGDEATCCIRDHAGLRGSARREPLDARHA